MRVTIKINGSLYDHTIQDLARSHPFAAERVGFLSGRIGSVSDEEKLILLGSYHSIPDDHYEDDPSVAACIGKEAITWAMQAVYHGRKKREGIFHVHVHDHAGETRMSMVDRRDTPKLIPGFQSVNRDAAHGIIILSRDHGTGWVWLPGCKESIQADCINVIGVPIGVFERRAKA